MNEIDLPTMTPEERRLLFGPPLDNFYGGTKKAWWVPVLLCIVCSSCVTLGMIVSTKSKPVPNTIPINPDTAICASHPELSQSGWLRVPESDKQRIAADARYRILSAQTIVCTDGAQSFQLREWWYKQEKSTWRRQGLAVHKE